MRAEYDSQADALSIDVLVVERWDGPDDPIDDTYCHVALASGLPANVELLNPREHLGLLDKAAERYELDAEKLKAAAGAALAAPDRVVTLEFGARAPAGAADHRGA
jgi:hypothetical protein